MPRLTTEEKGIILQLLHDEISAPLELEEEYEAERLHTLETLQEKIEADEPEPLAARYTNPLAALYQISERISELSQAIGEEIDRMRGLAAPPREYRISLEMMMATYAAGQTQTCDAIHAIVRGSRLHGLSM